MKQQAFIERHRQQWQKFEEELLSFEQANESIKLSRFRKRTLRDEVDVPNFVNLYRQICHIQAMATSRQYSGHLVAKLDDLVLRGHQLLYRHKPGGFRAVIHFIVSEFPQLVRQEQRYFWVASVIFYLPALLYFIAIEMRPELVFSVLDAYSVQDFEEMYNPQNRVMGEARDFDSDVSMFGFYVYNNISVSFRTFASGILFGIGSIFFLVVNGLLLGGVLGHLNNIGYIETISSFVIGHGSFELTAIIISGAAGMRIGFSLLSPGKRSRIEALKASSKIAIRLMYGVILMLVIAAFIEGFWSSSTIVSVEVKYAVGAGLWALVILYFARSGKHYAA